ncbi:MAG: TonB-dependent receptor [Holophagales bacterium]|nr:TonB-dependent receptor [Holophagales bacterium]
MRRLLVPVALLLVMALPALGALDGSISGVVKDKSGQPLPGVSVTVKGPVLQGTRTAITKGDGTYRVPSLPPGKGYLVSFLLSGFKVVTRSELSVGLNLDTQVNSTMELADVQTEVVVTGEAPVVDVTQTNTATNFNSDYLRNIPVGAANRSYQSLLNQTPGVVGTSNPSVLGGSSIENSYMIDGVNTTDPITHTWTVQMNFDTIQEVSVQTSGFEAEYGKATGGVVNVVTKSGGNDFSGTFDIRYRTSDMEKSGDHYDPNKAESRRTPWGATLGGPILKDNLWFFANMRRPDQYQIPYSAVPAYLAANTNPAIYRYTGWDYGGKLSFTLSPSYSGFFNYYNSSASIENPDLSVQRLPEATRNQDQATETFNLKLTGVFTSSWIGEFQAGQNENEVTSYPRSGDLSATQWQNRKTGVVYGGYSNSQGGPRNRKLIGANTSYFLADFAGNHQFKTGFDIDNTKYPSYNFTTGTPTDPSFCPTGFVCGATGTFAGFDASGARIPYSQAVTTRNPTYKRRADGFSAYIQDSWRPTARLTVNLGVRYDETAMFNNQDLQVMQFQRFQPRFAAAYDITGDGKTVARANYGQFYHEPGLTISRGLDTGVYSATTRNYRWNTTTKTWGFVNQTGGSLLTAPLVDAELRGPLRRRGRTGLRARDRQEPLLHGELQLQEDEQDARGHVHRLRRLRGLHHHEPAREVRGSLRRAEARLLRLHLHGRVPLPPGHGQRELRLLQEPGVDGHRQHPVHRRRLRLVRPDESDGRQLPVHVRVPGRRRPQPVQGLRQLHDPVHRDEPRPELHLSLRVPLGLLHL